MSLDWTDCFDCTYFEDCEKKESRDGCCFGDSIEEYIIIKLRKDSQEDWKYKESQLHTGEHSQ